MNKSYSEIRKAISDEAIAALTKKPIATYSSERVRLWSEIAAEMSDVSPQPLRFGGALYRFLSQVSIPVKDHDILIGRMVEETFTEDEEMIFRKKYINKHLKWHGIPTFITDIGHQSFFWNDVISKGLPAIRDHAQSCLHKHERAGDEKKCDFVRGMLSIYDAIILFINRSAEAAERAGLTRSAQACRKAASGAPDTLHSALQLIWSIEFIFCAYIAPNPTLTLGRLDLFLKDIYEKDIASGNLDHETASLLIDDFYAKNNLIMGRGEHQLSQQENADVCTGWHRILAYDSPQYLILSGTDPDSNETVASDLTKLFIERINPKYKNPVIVFRYTSDFAKNHADIWRSLIKSMRDSASVMIYNDIVTCKMYEKYGSSRREALSHEFFGCNWPTIPARDIPAYNVFHYGFDRSMAWTLFEALREHRGKFSREEMLRSVYDHFYRKITTEFIPNIPKNNDPNPNELRFCSCFSYKNAEKGGLYFDYHNLIVPFGGISTLIDMISAVDHLVNRKNISPERLFAACESEFENDPVIHALCKNAPKLGDGNETSAFWAKALTETIIKAYVDACKDQPDFLRLRFCAENDTWHIERGELFGATPDGRRKGEPIAQNCQPSVGAAKNGITAMLSSLACIPFENFGSGALNVTVQPSNFSGDNGLENLSNILSVYFEKGGLQIQLSSVDKELLLDAQKNPEMHRDLMVRITGYSAVFVDMCKKAQDDLISRNTF
ncbi:MAG: hypothetical protein IJZ03_03860 [Clostridia bacterium]|nr:hypothetical protein [Clostridia bacterium]